MRGGLSAEAANLATAGVGVILFLSAWIPVFYFDRLGRRTWLQIGTIGMFCALVGIAALLRHAESHPGGATNNAIVLFPYLFYIFFNMSWSSGSWTYAAEIFPISLRVSNYVTSLCLTIRELTLNTRPKGMRFAQHRSGYRISLLRRPLHQ
jgi:MFS family permease